MRGAVRAINELSYSNEITIFTNRPDYMYADVEAMLISWGIEYDRIICGKPSYDLFIDDKATQFKGWQEVYIEKEEEAQETTQQASSHPEE